MRHCWPFPQVFDVPPRRAVVVTLPDSDPVADAGASAFAEAAKQAVETEQLRLSLLQVALGGVLIVAAGVLLGSA